MEVPINAISITGYWTWMGNDGIARTKIKPDMEVTLDHAIGNSHAVNSLYIDKKFPLLIDSRGIRSMTREAREYFSTRGRETNTCAFGIVIKSPLSRAVGNFFLGLNKPAVPTRLFDNEKAALKWLTNYL